MSKRPLGFRVDPATITIKGPFKTHDTDAKLARAIIETQGISYPVAVRITAQSLGVVLGADERGQARAPTAEEIEEARALFAIVELARQSVKDLKRPQPEHLAEIQIQPGPGPDSGAFESGMRYEGMWAIASIRAHPGLRGYDISRDGSTWTARPKAS